MLTILFKRLAITFLLLTGVGFASDINLDTQIKGSRPPYFGTDSGAANAYVLTTIAPLGPTLRTGSKFEFFAANANTGASTLNVDSTGVISIVKNVSSALSAGDIAANGIVEVVYDGTNFQLLGSGSPISGGGGANKVQFDQCTAGQTANAGNSFWTVFAFTNWDAGHWEFVLNTNADVWCSVRVPSNKSGTMQIIVDLSSADTTSGHTATFNTADVCTSSLNPQVGALTAAATQNYSSTTTAFSNTELTFNVQSTCAIDQILVVKIHQASGGANTSNIFMQPPKLKVM